MKKVNKPKTVSPIYKSSKVTKNQGDVFNVVHSDQSAISLDAQKQERTSIKSKHKNTFLISKTPFEN
ncbi:hypothetical protein DID80_07225 [Candidatus Marinamargulisbacteria bacterium SCGC AAA071-K20]|nr:hypothetical protein DID80_07225 [Candidatus Marinamargulisbacteria bacterium SCGC AAA071-K20]